MVSGNSKDVSAKSLKCYSDASFTDWLFAEATKKSESATEPAPASAAISQPAPSAPETQARQSAPIRATPIYNQALNQALPSGSQSGQKRTASARSSSPTNGHPNKSRRTDLPTGPRSMHGGPQGNRSLLDRMGGRQQPGQWNQRNDDIQARIEAVTHQNGMGGGPMNPNFNGMPNQMGGMGMPDMNAFNNGMNSMALQEMMMNQMALMAQMANSMGMLNGQAPMMGPNGNQMNMQTPDGQNQGQGANRRGGGPIRGRGRGAGGAQSSPQRPQQEFNNTSTATSTPTTFAAPTPTPAAQATQPSAGFSPPERPQSPSLCKFGLKCTNALCRYSHASPVATPESGVVLSNDPCEAGVKCADKDCIKSHVSPAAVGVTSGKDLLSPFRKLILRRFSVVAPKSTPKPEAQTALKPPCRFGSNCTKVALGTCPYSHPFVPKSTASAVQWRFGAGCTRADCHFQVSLT